MSIGIIIADQVPPHVDMPVKCHDHSRRSDYKQKRPSFAQRSFPWRCVRGFEYHPLWDARDDPERESGSGFKKRQRHGTGTAFDVQLKVAG